MVNLNESNFELWWEFQSYTSLTQKNSPNFLSSPHLHARKFRGNELLIITFCNIGWLFRNPTIEKAMEKKTI